MPNSDGNPGAPNMPATIEIRDARDDDDWDLIGIIAGCWGEYPGCILDVHGEVPELLAIATHFKKLGGRFWVAVDDRDRAVACAGIGPGSDDATSLLHKLYVARRARRRGLGERLVRLVESEALQRGSQIVELWSDTRFDDAHRLYERLGYERVSDTRELHDLSNSVEYHYRRHMT